MIAVASGDWGVDRSSGECDRIPELKNAVQILFPQTASLPPRVSHDVSFVYGTAKVE